MNDLNTESVFDLETPAGARLRGGVRALEWLEEGTGERQLLAVVRASVPLELVPPNRLVARDAFEGVLADVVLEWRHDRFSQSVVLRELPEPPAGFEGRATRLVVVTEFVEAPGPQVQRVAVAGEGLAGAEDHVGIHFDGASILVGHAFVAGGDEPALQVGAGGARGEAVSVRKSWTALPGGGAVLEESVGWEALAALGAGLPRQAGASGAAERTWRTARVERASARRPVAVAQAPYRPAGLVVDFELVPGSASGFTFQMGQTYYVRSNFYVGPGTLTFQPGCTIKFRHNAWLLAYGPVSFPDTLQTPVFTSKDDDSFGERIAGVAGEPDSDGDPSNQKAAQALWIYYVNFDTTVRNARIRWAQRGVQYDVNPGVYLTHVLQRSLLEHCDLGVYANLQNASLILTDVEKHAVTTAISCPGYPYYPCGNISGTITQTPFYTDKSFMGMNRSDGRAWAADTMGAAGFTQFVEVVNRKLKPFDKSSGEPGAAISLATFLGAAEYDDVADPRIAFDALDSQRQRWVICAMDTRKKKVILKVSTQSAFDPASEWRTFEPELNVPDGGRIDFPTLGVDANGIYFSVQVFNSNGVSAGYRVRAFRKPAVYDDPAYKDRLPSMPLETSPDTWAIQPASNFSSNPTYTWFVAKGPSDIGGGGQIMYRRLQWTGETPSWSGDWQTVEGPYRNYFDIPQGTRVLQAPNLLGPGVELGDTGSRLMTAVIRGGYLWTCHHVGLDGTDGDYDGPAADRSAIQWFKLQVGTDGLTYSAHERIYDAASSNPYWYHFPSLNVNAAGNLLVGFSGCKATEYIGTFYRGRKANGVWQTRPYLVKAGRDSFNYSRWGDYSATSLDPADDSFWTIQQYAESDPADHQMWGTWAAQVRAP